MKLLAIAAVVMGLSGVAMAEEKAPSAPAAPAAPAKEVVKVNNAKCAVTGEDIAGGGAKVTHDGKEYNLCCAGCKEDFEKEPAKFVKAIDADPAKFGIKKDK